MSPAKAAKAGPAAEPILVATGVDKGFFGVPVLQGVSLRILPGTVHGLVGENGAGKSTFMKIVAGVHPADAGELLFDGRPVSFAHPSAAMRAGVATVFQEFNLLPERSVAENVYLGREPRRGPVVDRRAMNRDTQRLLDELGIDFIAPETRVGSLTVAEQQIVEIVKALSFDAKLISMDEPTAALADHEVELLSGIVRRLRDRGVAILYVSHRLKEIFDLCDDITVLKDGVVVSSGPASELDGEELVRRMVGRSIATFFPPRAEGTEIGDVRLAVRGGANAYLEGIDLEVRAGEIVGIAGLQGSGRTELVEAVFGAVPFERGTIALDGADLVIRSPRRAVRAGVALITEDRKARGLALAQSVLDNALLVIRGVFPRRTAPVRRSVPGVLSSLEVSFRGLDQEVRYLSGGNQQKVVLAKWLATEPRVVLLDEPTRGIDVGAKVAVYELMRQLGAQGVAILMVSSELPEVLGMADRVVVMRDGRVAGELPPTSTEEQVLALATGATESIAPAAPGSPTEVTS